MYNHDHTGWGMYSLECVPVQGPVSITLCIYIKCSGVSKAIQSCMQAYLQSFVSQFAEYLVAHWFTTHLRTELACFCILSFARSFSFLLACSFTSVFSLLPCHISPSHHSIIAPVSLFCGFLPSHATDSAQSTTAPFSSTVSASHSQSLTHSFSHTPTSPPPPLTSPSHRSSHILMPSCCWSVFGCILPSARTRTSLSCKMLGWCWVMRGVSQHHPHLSGRNQMHVLL